MPALRVTITANVGDHFPNGTDHTMPNHVEQWRVLGPKGELNLGREFRRDGNALAADVTLPAPGAYLATMTIGTRLTVMKGLLFNSYLQEEGLDWVIAARRNAGVSENNAKERFARYAKVAIRNGNGSGANLTRPVGFPAEFVPMTDPTLVFAGQLLTVQLLGAASLSRGPPSPLEPRAGATRSWVVPTRADTSRSPLIVMAHGWSVRSTWSAERTQACPMWIGIRPG